MKSTGIMHGARWKDRQPMSVCCTCHRHTLCVGAWNSQRYWKSRQNAFDYLVVPTVFTSAHKHGHSVRIMFVYYVCWQICLVALYPWDNLWAFLFTLELPCYIWQEIEDLSSMEEYSLTSDVSQGYALKALTGFINCFLVNTLCFKKEHCWILAVTLSKSIFKILSLLKLNKEPNWQQNLCNNFHHLFKTCCCTILRNSKLQIYREKKYGVIH